MGEAWAKQHHPRACRGRSRTSVAGWRPTPPSSRCLTTGEGHSGEPLLCCSGLSCKMCSVISNGPPTALELACRCMPRTGKPGSTACTHGPPGLASVALWSTSCSCRTHVPVAAGWIHASCACPDGSAALRHASHSRFLHPNFQQLPLVVGALALPVDYKAVCWRSCPHRLAQAALAKPHGAHAVPAVLYAGSLASSTQACELDGIPCTATTQTTR